MDSKRCPNGHKFKPCKDTFIGVQHGKRRPSLDLHNCPTCKTTVSIKKTKGAKQMMKTGLIVLATTILTGCLNQSSSNNPRSVIEPTPIKSFITFNALEHPTCLYLRELYINGQLIDQIQDGETLTVQVTPGEHNLISHTERNCGSGATRYNEYLMVDVPDTGLTLEILGWFSDNRELL